MGDKLDRYFIPALVGLAPVVFALMTWRTGTPSPIQAITLPSAVPIVIVELFVIVVALREGVLAYLKANPVPVAASVAIVAWIAIGIGTSLFVAPVEPAAMRWTVHWILHLLFGVAFAYLCARHVRIRNVVECYLIGFVIFTGILVAFVATYWGQPIDWVRTLPGAIHIRHVGIYAAAMTGMSIGAVAGARSRTELGLAFAVSTIGFAVGLWTGSRGMVLSVIGAAVAAVLLVPAMRRPQVIVPAVLSLAIAIPAVAWLPVPNGEMMGVTRTVEATTEHEVTTGRTIIWKNVAHAVERQPGFGYGPGQMPAVAPYYTMGQPHNLILQILLDWGFAGMTCVVVAAFFYVRRALPALRREGARLAAPFTAMMSLLLLSMIDAAMFHVLPVSIFAACAAMLASTWWGRPGAS